MSEEIEIEKDVPMRFRSQGCITAAIRKLEVGDSFIIPKKYAVSSCYSAAMRFGIKIALRTVEDGMRRVWRLQ